MAKIRQLLFRLGYPSYLKKSEVFIIAVDKTLAPHDIAMLRVRRILFGEKVIPSDYGDFLVESMISYPLHIFNLRAA